MTPFLSDITRTRIQRAVAVLAALFVLTSGSRSVLGHASEAPTVDPVPLVRVDPDRPDDPPEVAWQVLAGLDYMTGEVGEELMPFVGKVVRVPGFMVPLEDFAEQASEFLLVPYVGACVHTPPPPPNQLVYVKMAKDERVPVSFWDPVWIHGTLEIEESTNVYGSVSFKLTGTKVQKYEW